MNTTYKAPSIAVLQAELSRAGLSENDSHAGAVWILDVLTTRAKPKNTKDDRERIADLEKTLAKAVRLLEQVRHGDPASYRDLEGTYSQLAHKKPQAPDGAGIGDALENARQASQHLMHWRPGGRDETAHGRLIDDLLHLFRSYELPETVHNGSPLVSILAACAGLDSDASRKALNRRIKSGKSHYNGIDYERVRAEQKEVDKAYSESLPGQNS